MVTLILGVLLLFVLQSFLPPLLRYYLRKDPQILAALGPRDDEPEGTAVCQRSERALRNMIEALVVFSPVAILAAVKPGVDQADAVFGAQLFLIARLLYVPAYLLGVTFARSLIWTAGHVGILLIALTLV